MVIIHAYTPLHFMQLEYLLNNEVGDEKVYLIVPERFSSSVSNYASEMCEIINYNFDASSFSSTFFLSRANKLLKKIPGTSIQKIIVPDIAYSFSNYLVSRLTHKSNLIEVLFYFDGSGSMMSAPLPIKTRFSDLLKLFVSFVISNAKYIIRKNELSGADLSLCKKQFSIIENERLSYREKVVITPELIDLPSNFEASEDIVLFVLQDAKVLMPDYIKLYEDTLIFLSEKYPDYIVKVLLRNSDHESIFTQKENISRDFVGESAESIIVRLKPKVVVSHYSTVLFTLAFVKYEGEIVSFNLSGYNDIVGEKQEVTDEVAVMFKALDIKMV